MKVIPLVALGFAVHWGTISFEADTYVRHLIGLQTILFALLILYFSGHHGITTSIALASKATGSFHLGFWCSVILHRVFFHRLRNFPGPQAAKLSKFYVTWLSSQKSQLNLDIEELHQVYSSDFVRIGPRELSIKRQSAIPAIYGNKAVCSKGPWYNAVTNNPDYLSLHGLRNSAEHLRRRRAWDRSLSHTAVKEYAPRMAEKTSTLITQLLKLSASGPVNITEWTMRIAFDIMGECGLGKDFNALTSETLHPAIQGLHVNAREFSILATVPWLLGLLAALPGGASGFTTFGDYCASQVTEKRKVLEKDSQAQDILSWLLLAQWSGDKSAPPETAFPEDSRLLIVAGSDTTASLMANILFYLVRYPEYLQQLVESLDQLFPNGDEDWDADRLTIPLLDGIIHEALRLAPSVPGGLQRVTPPGGMMIDEVFVPGNIIVSVPTWSIQRDPRYWEDADKFKPERWMEGGLNPETAPAFLAFTKGPYACAGKAFARQELRMVISRIVLNFSLRFADKDGSEKFEDGGLDYFTLMPPPLYLSLQPRKGSVSL
ncbi:cytochrome P450 [Flagelloscypha sp. PMI_526]|nr:cytochrome P450 [Flagelloscypha sp. PMI_526]